MDSYTVIYGIDTDKNDKIKNLLSEGDDENKDYYTFNGKHVQVKHDRIIVKDISFNDINACTKEFEVNKISVLIKEYIGKKTLNDDEIKMMNDNISNSNFYVHTNKDINDNNDILMFSDPVRFGSAYGLINKNVLMIFSRSLVTIKNIFDLVLSGCNNLSSFSGNVVLTI